MRDKGIKDLSKSIGMLFTSDFANHDNNIRYSRLIQ
jgi:hypothetical protein